MRGKNGYLAYVRSVSGPRLPEKTGGKDHSISVSGNNFTPVVYMYQSESFIQIISMQDGHLRVTKHYSTYTVPVLFIVFRYQ